MKQQPQMPSTMLPGQLLGSSHLDSSQGKQTRARVPDSPSSRASSNSHPAAARCQPPSPPGRLLPAETAARYIPAAAARPGPGGSLSEAPSPGGGPERAAAPSRRPRLRPPEESFLSRRRPLQPNFSSGRRRLRPLPPPGSGVPQSLRPSPAGSRSHSTVHAGGAATRARAAASEPPGEAAAAAAAAAAGSAPLAARVPTRLLPATRPAPSAPSALPPLGGDRLHPAPTACSRLLIGCRAGWPRPLLLLPSPPPPQP